MSELTTFIVEVKYSKRDEESIVAKFDLRAEAERYVNRHQNDGGGHLRIKPTSDYNHLEFVATPNTSFTWYVEAAAYAQRFGLSVYTVDGSSRETVSDAVDTTDRDNSAQPL